MKYYAHIPVAVLVMVAASLLTTLFLALALRATAFMTTPLTKSVPSKPIRIVHHDRLRANYIMGYDVYDVENTPVANINASAYFAVVGVGMPPTNCK